ncbi:MAG: hypothetical protein HDQ90_01785 [Desulfovibrio sp.]|nr:hypothetical protein [Desulfovibrio sp.]
MQLSLEKLVKIAKENQPIILEQELQKGVPLNYIDEHDPYVLRDPDGHVEKAVLPKLD